jgi:phosphoribosylglycinamide formyltransferase-1
VARTSVFGLIERLGHVSRTGMDKTFNNGIRVRAEVVAAARADRVLDHLRQRRVSARRIGVVARGTRGLTFVRAIHRPLALGVLLSGSGTNLQALIDAIAAGRLHARIAVVVSNIPEALGVERARRHGLPTVVVAHRDAPSREAYDARLVEILRTHAVTLVALAGFMRLVSPVLLAAYPSRVLNVHPALLPAFPGLHAERQALAHGARITGVTVHFVDEETDHGPILAQAAVPILPDDTEATLHARIQREEHRLYPFAIQLIAEGRVRVDGRRVEITGGMRAPVGALANPEPPTA